MMILLNAYKWTFFGGILGGTALSLIGSQLASRNQSVHTLVVSQAAALGTVLGLTINIISGDGHSHELSLVPLLCSFLVAFIFYIICEVVVPSRWPSRNTYYVGIFSLLLSGTYAVISLVPGLETHMAASYFGDLAVASDFDSLIMAIVGACGLLFFGKFWRQVTAWSFDSVTFGISSQERTAKKVQGAFVALSLVIISASIQLLGFLFTISCLFLSTMVLTRTRPGLRGFPQRLATSTSIGVALGFVFSLWHGKIPTVPSIGAALILSSLIVGFGFRK